jgi:hypothetical protein
MEPATAALISSGISGVVALSAAVYSGRTQKGLTQAQKELDDLQAKRQEERDERRQRTEAKAVLDTYRGPLLNAAWELGDRIDNIRRRGFGLYAQESDPRRTTAVLTTAFRFAQYFGWREVVRIETQLLKFDSARDTRAIAELLGSIAWIFASDSPGLNVRVTGSAAATDNTKAALDAPMRSGAWLMLWLEEQRGIGEFMRLEPESVSPRSRGYGSFVRDYDAPTRRRLEGYAEQVLASARTKTGVPCDSARLRLLQLLFLGLVLQLDEERVYPPYPDGWIDRTWHDIYLKPPLVEEQTEQEKSVRTYVSDLPSPWRAEGLAGPDAEVQQSVDL